MNFLQITSLLIVLAGGFGAINYLFLKLPSAIGILIVSLLASFILLALDLLIPASGIADTVRGFVTGIDFSEALLEGMLGLLLFACAALLHGFLCVDFLVFCLGMEVGWAGDCWTGRCLCCCSLFSQNTHLTSTCAPART